MNRVQQLWRTKSGLPVTAITVCGNALGATLWFVYFAWVESGLVRDNAPQDLGKQVVFFVVGTAAIIVLVTAVRSFFFRPVAEDINAVLARGNEEQCRAMTRDLLNAPLAVAGSSMAGWLVAGGTFTFLPPAFELLHGGDWHRALKVLFGLYLVGAPTTLTFIYFVMEWQVRRIMIRQYPPGVLDRVPQSVPINVLPKMLVVSFMMGAAPLAMISAVTLDQIYQISTGKTSIDAFVSRMPAVVIYLFILGFIAVAALSVLMSRSVSEPLRATGAAMGRIAQGDLNVTVPVVSNDEIGLMAEGFNRMVEGLRERDLIRDTFGRYVSRDVAAEILKSPAGLDLGGELRDITILVADLRGFTRMTAALGPRTVVRILNVYLERMTAIIIRHEGTIDEFTGDGILVFFGAPTLLPDHPKRAVACALAMQGAMISLNDERACQGLPLLEMGIGINCGELVVGNIGCEQRRKYGAVGSPINVAFRVEAQSGGGEILVTPSVYGRLRDEIKVAVTRKALLKGFDEPLNLYLVSDLRDRDT